jgi:hypothetical protein
MHPLAACGAAKGDPDPYTFGGPMSEMADFCVGSLVVLAFLWWSSLA